MQIAAQNVRFWGAKRTCRTACFMRTCPSPARRLIGWQPPMASARAGCSGLPSYCPKQLKANHKKNTLKGRHVRHRLTLPGIGWRLASLDPKEAATVYKGLLVLSK